jgi:hypothetical protein
VRQESGAAPQLYSPRPPAAYTRPCEHLGQVGIGAEMERAEVRPQWNLYWLSEPRLDFFLNDITVWQAAPSIDPELLVACFKAVTQQLGGSVMRDLLLKLSPVEFVARVKSSPHKHLAPYVLRGPLWTQTIERRAALFRGALASDGSIVHANFGRKAVDEKVETKPASPARIMTLAFRKT